MESVIEPNQQLLRQLASGRRIVNLCLFAWLAAAAFRITGTPFAVLFFLGSTIAAVVGALRVTEGLGFSASRKAFAVLGSAIPLFGLLVMAWLSHRSTKELRSSGYAVGMFQSSKGP